MRSMLDALTPESGLWFEFILDATFKVILVVGLAMIVLLIWKKASYAMRHLVLILTLISILIIPLLSFILPEWEISLFPSSFSPGKGIMLEGETMQSPQTSLTSSAMLSSVPHINKGEAADKRINWPAWLLLLWSAGTLCFSTRFLAGLIGTHMILRRGKPVRDREFRHLASIYARRLDLRRKIWLLESGKVVIPMTCGWLKPTVVIPEEALSWPDKRKEIVLLHEFAHIKRGDYLTSVLSFTASIFYWFNPLVWIIVRRLYLERERASDTFVLASGMRASEYASHLLEIAKRLSSVRWLSPVGIALTKKSNLEERIMSILKNKEPFKSIKKTTLFMVIFLSLGFIIPVASLHTWAQEEEKAEKVEKQEETTQDVEPSTKEEIKKTLKDFYYCIESLDISGAIDFFAELEDFKEKDKYPLIIISKSDEGGNVWLASLGKGTWKKIKVDSKVNSVTKKGNVYIVNEDLAIVGLNTNEKHNIKVEKPGHCLILLKEDGQWKIKEMEKGHLVINSADEKEGVKKVGVVINKDGVNCIILAVNPKVVMKLKEKDK